MAGELTVDGGAPRDARGRLGLLAQDPDSQLVMTRAGDDVAFGLENAGLPADEIWPRVDAALAAVGFPYGRDRPTQALSGGEKQRLVLAGVLARRPGLLLLDEPTAQLDPPGAALVREAVARVTADRSATTIVVDHDAGPWLPLVDRVVEVVPGGLVEHGPRLAPRLRAPPACSSPRPPPAPCCSPRRPPGTATAGAVSRRCSPTTPDLRSGRALAVTGPNGTGKSTLALLLAGLRAPTVGRVTAAAELTAGVRHGHPRTAPVAGRGAGQPDRHGLPAPRAAVPHRPAARRARPGAAALRRARRRRAGHGRGAPRAAGSHRVRRRQPVHAVRRPAAPAVGRHRARHRARGCSCSTSPRSARTRRPGGSWSPCWPSSGHAAARSRSSPTTPTWSRSSPTTGWISRDGCDVPGPRPDGRDRARPDQPGRAARRHRRRHPRPAHQPGRRDPGRRRRGRAVPAARRRPHRPPRPLAPHLAAAARGGLGRPGERAALRGRRRGHRRRPRRCGWWAWRCPGCCSSPPPTRCGSPTR